MWFNLISNITNYYLMSEELIMDLLIEKQNYSHLMDYISQNKMKKSIRKIRKCLDKKLAKSVREFFSKQKYVNF